MLNSKPSTLPRLHFARRTNLEELMIVDYEYIQRLPICDVVMNDRDTVVLEDKNGRYYKENPETGERLFLQVRTSKEGIFLYCPGDLPRK